MKKVRLAIYAALPTVGLLAIPAAEAHAATTPAGKTGGHLSPAVPGKKTAVPFASGCPIENSVTQVSPNREFLGGIGFGGNCVHVQTGTLDRSQTGLTERVRYYTSGKLTKQEYLGGHIASGGTFFASYPKYYATEVCQALVSNGNHNTVKYGPVCEYTS